MEILSCCVLGLSLTCFCSYASCNRCSSSSLQLTDCTIAERYENSHNNLCYHLLVQKDIYPRLGWPLQLRILYEISLGVNFLHNMNPPLLHHDLKTQNILLDGEFHVKVCRRTRRSATAK